MSGQARPVVKGREISTTSSRSEIALKGQVQNVKAARVYVFGDNEIVEDDICEATEMEMPEIRSRRSQNGGVMASGPAEAQELFYEKEIAEGETLQSLSLKFACPMSELKRINNLIIDQDFFALRILKIPMRRHGYLSELVQQELSVSPASRHYHHQQHPHRFMHPRDSAMSDSDVPLCSDMDFSDPETQMRIIRCVSIRDNFSRKGREASQFFKKMDRDLQKLRQKTATDCGTLDEVVSQLTRTSFYPLQKSALSSKSCGADCGMSWWMMVLIAMTVTMLFPIAYFIYVTFFFDREHHS